MASEPYLSDPDVTLWNGDALEVLRGMESESVDCCMTSPPYWGLRDYGTGAWTGGDGECDHAFPVSPQRDSPGGFHNSQSRGEQPASAGVARQQYRDACGKCGATRTDRQLGLEPTPEEYVANMVTIFEEVRRVLSESGTLWLNLGDSYAGGAGGRGDSGRDIPRSGQGGGASTKHDGSRLSRGLAGLKPKDLIGIPWRVAFALQAAGWYLRSDIIWAKPNPMPESVTDRPTKAHEYVFLLTKSPRYYFGQEDLREKAEWARWGDQTNRKHEGSGSAAGWIQSRSKEDLQRPQARRAMELFEKAGLTEEHARAIRAVGITDTGKATVTQNGTGKSDPELIALANEAKEVLGGYYREFLVPNGRNVRSVWEIATEPYPDAHFATFPTELARRCILGGCPEWVCRTCGKAREAIVERVVQPQAYEDRKYDRSDPKFATKRNMGARHQAQLDANPLQTIGYTDCGHGTVHHFGRDRDQYRPGIVLDPFAGSGTVGYVTRKLSRRAVLIELSEDYCKLAARRLAQLSLLAEPL